MGIQSSARVNKPSRRPIVVAGLVSLQLLLMGAAFEVVYIQSFGR